MHPTLQAILVTGAGVLGWAGFLVLANALLDAVAARRTAAVRHLRAWLFLAPAALLLVLYLGYPLLETLRLSVSERLPGGGLRWVGLDNYARMTRDPAFREAFGNTALWLIVVPAVSTGLGLLIAQLTDRLRWRALATSLVFMPMAISLVGAAVIFKLIYDFRPEDQAQIGLLNALYLSLGGQEPQAWLTRPGLNTFLLMAVLVWIQTGFAMVILSAALRAVPCDILEAARLDGARPFQVLRHIQIPHIWPTITVVWVTITITVLKVFDVVFAMTNGQWGTEVLANYMFGKLFRANDWGVGSAAALVLLILVLPVVIWTWRATRREAGQ